MTLNTARKIETAFNVVTIIILLPFALVIQILEWLIKLLTLPIDGRNWLSQKLGNKLMHMSDAVKESNIINHKDEQRPHRFEHRHRQHAVACVPQSYRIHGTDGTHV